MAIRKPEILINAILNVDNNERSDVALGLAIVLSNLSEINDAVTKGKLEALKKDCFRGLSLDECLELYSIYRSTDPFKEIFVDGLNLRFRLLDLKGAFRDLYYKVIDYVLNIDFGADYSIGSNTNDADEIFKNLKGALVGKGN